MNLPGDVGATIVEAVIIAAADGSSLSNPGPAGWAWYVSDDIWASGGWEHGTNNMGELMAVLDLLESTAHIDEPLRILCDSQYVINSLTKWLPGWKRKGWKKGDGKPVLNVELMKALDEALRGREVEFEWVKGHAGHAMNEAADVRARAAATAYQQGTEPPTGPGFPASLDRPKEPRFAVGQVEAQPDLFAELPAEDAPQPVPGTAGPRQKAALVRAARQLFKAPATGRLHPDLVVHTAEGQSRVVPWDSAVLAELLSVDLLSAQSALVQATVAGRLTALVFVEVPGAWALRFVSVS